MAKNKPRRRKPRGRYIKGNVDENLSLGTLASGVLVSDTWDETVGERTLISSIDVSWSMDLLTAPQGPFVFGVAHSDYSDAEIQEVLDESGSWNEGNLVSREHGKRLVRKIGVMSSEQLAGTVDVLFMDGKKIKTKLNWILTTGDTLKMWILNRSATAVATTVPVLKADGHANLWAL